MGAPFPCAGELDVDLRHLAVCVCVVGAAKMCDIPPAPHTLSVWLFVYILHWR